MGWTGHKLPGGHMLFTRGGTCGVYVKPKNSELEIEIPQKMLRMLVASDILSARVGELEQMSDNELLGLKKGQ
jgi:hypothetical protein